MEIWQRLSQQRVKYIVSSYQLSGQADGNAEATFSDRLEKLLQHYPASLIELALVETLVDGWFKVPLLRGTEFLTQAYTRLKTWENQPIVTTITPDQFQQITGLDPTPVFGSGEIPQGQSTVSS